MDGQAVSMKFGGFAAPDDGCEEWEGNDGGN
jgi:hypothetical protein